MDPTPGTSPSSPPPGDADPLAVGVANASLLGGGYALLRRPGLALGAALVSLALVGFLAASPSWWREVLLLAWWVFVSVHGWYLAGGRPARGAWRAEAGESGKGGWLRGIRRQRLLALTAAVPLVLSVAIARFDAHAIEGDATAAHREGDCERSLARSDALGFFHRLYDAPLTSRVDDEAEACELLVEAERLLDSEERVAAAGTFADYADHASALWEGARDRGAELYLAEARDGLDAALAGGDVELLAAAFDQLDVVWSRFPERGGEAEEALDGFLGALPTDDACVTREIAGWLDATDEEEEDAAPDTALGRSVGVVPEIQPAALVGCGEELLSDERWESARAQYRGLVDRYPDHELAGEAEQGIERAETGIELEAVRALLDDGYGGEPDYCDDPAPYRGAPAYDGGGPHPALLFNDEEGTGAGLPDSWRAEGAEDAVLVVCLGTAEMGAAVETCPYESDLGINGSVDVTFHELRVPLRAYELRTGELVSDSALAVGGASCPAVLTYETYTGVGIPPSEVYVEPSDSDRRAAYRPLIEP
ncbi:hypothetical protein SAMN06297387_109176 [Streptomyces zhaozhouensis]|uniref:Uncharacterized protein n=1 Tax=Streptomyces zhaozhouensis TaxID=1300267 RepID=A0A286DX66_9ACTN|nr:hypothetical protein [Streptomyces zhaozhouensis]SOD63233.1 hypothetical protein SAMN06297387_109176 [Streptomyces zhaozhouensis]